MSLQVNEPNSVRGASYYSWTIDGEPVIVQLNLDMVDRLGHQVIRKFREVHEPGSEIGGILLGRVVRGAGTTTFFIDDYELVCCEYRNGALFSLSDQDKGRMVDQLLRLKASSPYSAIGFFRSHTRKDLSLDDKDLALIREYFAGPATVSLLVKPFGTKPSTASFFVWQNGDLRAGASHFQFPFKRSELVIRSPERIVG